VAHNKTLCTVSDWNSTGIFISVINQLDAQNFCFTISLFHAYTCFEHMCSKHVEAWNKIIVKQKFRASSWLITEINILRCTVSKTSKHWHIICNILHWYQCSLLPNNFLQTTNILQHTPNMIQQWWVRGNWARGVFIPVTLLWWMSTSIHYQQFNI